MPNKILSSFEDYLKHEEYSYSVMETNSQQDDYRISWKYIIQNLIKVGIFENKYFITKNHRNEYLYFGNIKRILSNIDIEYDHVFLKKEMRILNI